MTNTNTFGMVGEKMYTPTPEISIKQDEALKGLTKTKEGALPAIEKQKTAMEDEGKYGSSAVVGVFELTEQTKHERQFIEQSNHTEIMSHTERPPLILIQ